MKKSILTALISFGMICMPAACLTAYAATNTAKTVKISQQNTRGMWAPETLSGKITMVDPARSLVIVQDSNGVPFDIMVNRSTRIQSANGSLNLDTLNSDVNHNASITFIPERRGDIAKTINVSR